MSTFAEELRDSIKKEAQESNNIDIEVLKRSISNSIRRYGKWTCYCHGYITNTSIGISSACKPSDKNELLEKLRFLGFTPYYGTNNFGSNYIEVICR